MRNLIAFVGFKASGKNTAAQVYPHKFIRLGFDDALKDTLAAIFCWDRQLLEDNTEERRLWSEQVDPWWAAKLDIAEFTPRWAMMNIDNEVMRRHNELWVFNVERRISIVPDNASIILIVRSPNEIALARHHNGYIVRIKRGPDPEWMELAWIANQHPLPIVRDQAQEILQMRGIHLSEYAWVGHRIDETIENNGTIDDLHEKVDRLQRKRYQPR